MNRLFTDTLTDLGAYEVTAAAGTPDEAQSTARTVVYEEMTRLPEGTRIVARETDTKVEVSNVLTRPYRVTGTYSIGFEMTVPATNSDEAGVHARRLYEEACGSFMFEIGDTDVRWDVAREMVS